MKKGMRKIVWALDPFEPAVKPSNPAVHALQRWTEDQGAEVLPVYVAASSNADASLGLLAPVADLEKKLNSFVTHLGVKDAKLGHVIVDSTTSREGAVKQLLLFARKQKADLIALTSHGRSGLTRLVLGSFAENLLRHSQWPVLFLARQHGASARAEKRSILFATDFSENSKAAFRQLLESADLSDTKVLLYHAVLYPIPYGEGASVYVPENYFETEERDAKAEGARWLEEAKKCGVAAELCIRDGGVGSNAGDSIVKAASELHAGMVVMASTSGALNRTLFGSAAYEVFRSAHCPVLVYGAAAIHGAPTVKEAKESRDSGVKNIF